MSSKVYFFTFYSLLIIGQILSAQTSPRGITIKTKTAEGKTIEFLYGRSYAMVIGVSDYTNGWDKLPKALNDAIEVKSELEKHDFEVTLLSDPTEEELDNGIKNFIATKGTGESKKNDRLLFYFSGHGHTIKKSTGVDVGYIVPSDAPHPHEDESGFIAKAISMERFESDATNIDAKHVLYIFDSCFSGQVFHIAKPRGFHPIAEETGKAVRQVITAGDKDEVVPDESLFKKIFLEALRGEAAEACKDGFLTGTELGAFLQENIKKYSNDTQHPQFGKIRNPLLDKGDFVFVMEPPPAFYGNIHVRTNPWCTVLLDDNEVCTSPFVIRNVKPGMHKIVLRREGFQSVEKVIKITENNKSAKIFETLTIE